MLPLDGKKVAVSGKAVSIHSNLKRPEATKILAQAYSVISTAERAFLNVL